MSSIVLRSCYARRAAFNTKLVTVIFDLFCFDDGKLI